MDILASLLDPGHREGIRPQRLRWRQGQVPTLWPSWLPDRSEVAED